MAENLANVATPCRAYNAMAAKWELIDDLLGGTQSMRDAGQKWLPKEKAENDEAYLNRIAHSFLYGALSDTIEKFTAKPFSKLVTLEGGDLDPRIQPIYEDADMNGTSLTEFSRAVFRDGLGHGGSYIMPDFQDVARLDEQGQVVTPDLGAEMRGEVRPYFQHFPSSNVIGWRHVMFGGKKILTQLRVKEDRYVPDGMWGETQRHYVRVYTPDSMEEWVQNEQTGEWVVSIPEKKHTFGRIPLVPVPIRPTGFMTYCPPFEDLGWLNLKHWQSSSDQDHILHYARVPMLVMTGISDEEKKKPTTIGSDRALKFTSVNAKAQWVEHSGAAINAGQADLEKLEARMEVLGLSPALERMGDQTATARQIDDSNVKNAIQGWIRVLESAIKTAYQYAAEMADAELPEEFEVKIFQDFGINARAQQDIAELGAARARKEIDHETYLYELKRRGTLDESTDIKKVMAATKREGPALGLLTAGPGGQGNLPFGQQDQTQAA